MLFYITLIVNGFTASTLQFPCELAFLEAIEAQESAGWNWHFQRVSRKRRFNRRFGANRRR